MDSDTPGVVYLLCFSEPLHHARHYLGWTNDLAARLRCHAKGDRKKCVLTHVIATKGITFKLVRTWRGPISEEKRLKRRKNNAKLCPACNEKIKEFECEAI